MEPFKVLLIDDNESFATLMDVMLERNYANRIRFKCISKQKDIKNAHNIILKYKPDLVFLDYMLEAGYGSPASIKIYADLISSPDFHLCPIFFITGLLAEDCRLKILKSAGNGFKIEIIQKPFTEKKIIGIVNACIKSREDYA